MNKKLQLALVALAIFFTTTVKADPNPIIKTDLNLLNPDVRKCLLESSDVEGWEVSAIYMNSDNKLVYIFSKGDEDRKYISNK